MKAFGDARSWCIPRRGLMEARQSAAPLIEQAVVPGLWIALRGTGTLGALEATNEEFVSHGMTMVACQRGQGTAHGQCPLGQIAHEVQLGFQIRAGAVAAMSEP